MNSRCGNDSPATRSARRRHGLSNTDFSQGQDGELFGSEKPAVSERIKGAMGANEKKDISAIHTKHMPEEPLRFQIPRKNKEKQELFQSVPLESREFENLLTILSSSYRDAASSGSFIYTRPRLVHSELLEKEFVEKRRELKLDGRTEKELEETHCFLLSDTLKLPWICDKGLSVGHSWITALGNPGKGVYLSKYSDLLQINPFSPGVNGEVIIFKVMKGKVKSIYENMSKSLLDPTPRFDSHFSKNAGKVTSLTSYRAYELTQQYFYEYSFDELRPRPRQVCPLAVVTFQFKGKDSPLQKHTHDPTKVQPLTPAEHTYDPTKVRPLTPAEHTHDPTNVRPLTPAEHTHDPTKVRPLTPAEHTHDPTKVRPLTPAEHTHDPTKVRPLTPAEHTHDPTKVRPLTPAEHTHDPTKVRPLTPAEHTHDPTQVRRLTPAEHTHDPTQVRPLTPAEHTHDPTQVRPLTPAEHTHDPTKVRPLTPIEHIRDPAKRCNCVCPAGRRRYVVWTGELMSSDKVLYQVCLHSFSPPFLPFKLPEKLDVGWAMRLGQVTKLLPSSLFSWNLYAGSHEVLKNGHYCSLLEMVDRSRTGDHLAKLLQGLEDNQVVLINLLIDGGFLLLLSSAQMAAPSERGDGWKRCLQALFIFPEARDVTKYVSRCLPSLNASETLTAPPLVMPQLHRFVPALHHALLKVRGNPPADLSAGVERQALDYLSGQKDGKVRLYPMEGYDSKLDDRGRLFPAPKHHKLNMEGYLRSYVYGPSLYLLPAFKARDMVQLYCKAPEEEEEDLITAEDARSPASQCSLASVIGSMGLKDVDLRRDGSEAAAQLLCLLNGLKQSAMGGANQSMSEEEEAGQSETWAFDRLADRLGLPPNRDIDLRKRSLSAEDELEEQMSGSMSSLEGFSPSSHSGDQPRSRRAAGGERRGLAVRGGEEREEEEEEEEIPWVLIPITGLRSEKYSQRERDNPQDPRFVQETMATGSYQGNAVTNSDLRSPTPSPELSPTPPHEAEQEEWSPTQTDQLAGRVPPDLGGNTPHISLTEHHQTSSYPERSRTPSPEPLEDSPVEEEKEGGERAREMLEQEEKKTVEKLKEGERLESREERVDEAQTGAEEEEEEEEEEKNMAVIQTNSSTHIAPTPPVHQRAPVCGVDSIVQEQLGDFSSEMQLLLHGESVDLNSRLGPSTASATLHTPHPPLPPFSEYVLFYSSSLPVLDYVSCLREDISTLLDWQQAPPHQPPPYQAPPPACVGDRGGPDSAGTDFREDPFRRSRDSDSRDTTTTIPGLGQPGQHPQANPIPEPSPRAHPQANPIPELSPRAHPQANPIPEPSPRAHPQANPIPEPSPRAHPQANPIPEPSPRAHPQANPITEPSPGAHPQAISSLISQLHPEVFSNLQEIMKDVQRNSVQFYIHSMEREDKVHDNIKEYLRRLGNLEMSPMSFLDKDISMDKLLIIIQNKDIAEHIHKIPNLVSLKRRPSVVFAGVDSLDDMRNNTYNELFISGGSIVSDEFILNPDFITHERLRALLMFLEQQSSSDSMWKWRIHLKTMKKLKELARFKREAGSLLSVLSSYQQRGVMEVLPYHQCDLADRAAPDLACLIHLQAHCIHTRHLIFLTERRFEMFPNYSSSGVVIANIDDIMHHFNELVGFHDINDQQPITLDTSAIKDLDGQCMEVEPSPVPDPEHHAPLQPLPGLPPPPLDQLVPDPTPPGPSGSSSSSLPSTEGGGAGGVVASPIEPDFEALRLAISQFKADRRARGLLDTQAADFRVNPNQSFLPGPGESNLSPSLAPVVPQPPSPPSGTSTPWRGSETGQDHQLTPSRQAMVTNLASIHARLGLGLVEPISDSDMSVCGSQDSLVNLPNNNLNLHSANPTSDTNPSTDCFSTSNGTAESASLVNEKRDPVDRCSDFPSSPVLCREGLPDTPESPDPQEHSRCTTTASPPEGTDRAPVARLNLDSDPLISGGGEALSRMQTLLHLQLPQLQHQQHPLETPQFHPSVQQQGNGLLPRPPVLLNSSPPSLGLLTSPPFHHSPMLGALGAIRGLMPGAMGPNMGPLTWAQGLGPAGAAFVWGLQQHHNRDMGGSLMGSYPNQGRGGGLSRGRGGFSSL
ncbi:protein TASOR-like [Aplochiton taeniatus]